MKGPSFRGVPEPLQPVEEEVSELELEEAQSFSEPSLSPRPRIQQHAEYASYLPLVTASGDRSVSLWNKGVNGLLSSPPLVSSLIRAGTSELLLV